MDFTGVNIDGVVPGGLHEDYEIKILICCLLEALKEPLSKAQMNEVLTGNGLVNYFQFAEAVGELLNNGHMEVIEEMRPEGEYYRLLPKGAQTAREFEKSLPLSVREKAVNNALQLQKKAKLHAQNKAEIEQVADGFLVSCVMQDIGSDLLRVSLFVPTKEQAHQIRDRFLDDPEILYRSVLEALT
ncbi:DUF4364 family protein [Zongyangia hominis]|nr:DUF4364 family protein [Zongyangia hominis]